MKEYVLITGASSGIGYDLAWIFGENNYNLILVARNEKRLNEIKKELNNKLKVDIRIFQCDLACSEDIENLYSKILHENLKVKYLINNAGCGSFGKFDNINIKTDLNLIDVNVRSITHMMKLFIPVIRKTSNGGVLNIASTAAFSPGPYMSVYYASKAYVINLTEALREEFKEDNIKICALCPGPTKTNFQINSKINKNSKVKPILMESRKVAEIAYRDFMKNKGIIVPGYNNKILVTLSKLLPNKLLCKVIKRANSN